ncbi:MAG: hypothetical protein EAZ57_11010 [Cytophagales bacterium]|nr:MAG: hypothetical protein EAZ67_11495 [Cytophagales bacterium]TAF59499.1 MAG: hypothetical protein EAZ57_11010 [Cytophagales bacterium]
MKKNFTLLALIVVFCLAPRLSTWAQDDDFNMSDFSAADSQKVKSFCTNKVLNLSPSKIVSLSYDFVSGFLVTNEQNIDLFPYRFSPVSLKHGLRIDATVPIISNRKIIVSGTFNHWETHYRFKKENNGIPFSSVVENTPLRTSALGFLVFKPLSVKHFIIVQAEAALNGTYDFNDTSPDFGALKYSAAALFGWKFNDYTNFAIGAVRTYRGGRLLHLPALLYNKTFNDRWGLEMLLPARAMVRYNFSAKSLVTAGFEVEGHSYRLQTSNTATSPKLELRRSEVRFRLGWDKALTDFIWLNLQGGVRYGYRFDIDEDASSTEPLLSFNVGLPLYFRFGISLVSP